MRVGGRQDAFLDSTRRSHSRSSMYRRMASWRNSLILRPSSLSTYGTCSAISCGMEKVMTLDFLGMDSLSLCRWLYYIVMNEKAGRCQEGRVRFGRFRFLGGPL